MRRFSFIAFGLLLGIEFGVSFAHAGPLMPCVTATLSANSRILVLNELTFDDPDETRPRHWRTSTFRVLSRYAELNEGMRLNGPDAYWAHTLWSVVFTSAKAPAIACPYALVTDDGEYLIFVGSGYIGTAALSIYHRRDHPGQPVGAGPDHGVLVREIPLRDLWPQERIPDNITDHTPQWFASGTFSFLPDNQTLVHRTRWGTTFLISLATGEIKGQ